MSSPKAELVTQLNILLRLTATEAATARARTTQATTADTRRELTENARKCDERAAALRSEIAALGGVQDVVGVAVGKATTAARLPFEQALPILEALLADLALEHQLFDRARLVKVLAHEADSRSTIALAERLEEAHGATIEWLFTVLGETAIGGPGALAPTGTQTAAAAARHAALFAGTAYVKGVNKAVSSASDLTSRLQVGTSSAVTSRLGRARDLASSARKVVTVGRNAGLAEAERQAEKDDADGTARGVHRLREQLGVVSAAELPIAHFDELSNRDAIAAVRELDEAEDVRVVLAYEQEHKARAAVVAAGEKRVRDIAKDLVTN